VGLFVIVMYIRRVNVCLYCKRLQNQLQINILKFSFMKLINKENGEELVEVGSHKEYASKGVAGTGLGLGIAGTALWLLSGGLGGGLFGNRAGVAAAAGIGAEGIAEKEDKCELINGMWSLAYNGQNARFNDRQTINAEMFGLYKS
jgi:hypothetical protein